MSNPNFLRQVAAKRNPQELRLPPFPRLPEKLVRAFPELREYEMQVEAWSGKTAEQIRIALDEANSDDAAVLAAIAAFEEELQ